MSTEQAALQIHVTEVGSYIVAAIRVVLSLHRAIVILS
jgi:hypothetical protein